ncbi:MAG: hypothetical protein J1F28_06720 [Oscillospiraceae bacterium]|nr:hypothetical protein [Oscillospiraceae bacterium]
MKKVFITLVAAALGCLLLLSGCSKKISSITDIERYSDMQKNADKIDVKFDNYSGEPFRFTITNEDDLEEIMEILFSETLSYLGEEFPVGDNTFITIYQGEKSYSLSVRFISENEKYYGFSPAKLQPKIKAIATALGAFDNVE